MRLQHKMSMRYDRALRKAVKMERKLLKRKHERSVYPTMAQQVDFSLNPYKPMQYAAAQQAPPKQQIIPQEPQIVQRQWQNLGRLYTCYTCMGCMMAIPCQQQIYSPQQRPQPAMVNPVMTQSPCGQPMAAAQRPQRPLITNNCQCNNNGRTCSQPHTRGCEENGQFYEIGQSTVKSIGTGFIKCQCIARRNEAVWRCNPQPAQAATVQRTKQKTCYDGTMPGVPFLPNEVWRSTRKDKQYSCTCKKMENGKSRTECALVRTDRLPDNTLYCIDRKTEQKREINQKWESGSRECACLVNIQGQPTIDCRNKKDAGCIIKGRHVRFEDVVDVAAGQQCECGPRGVVNCFRTCTKSSKTYTPGQTTITKSMDGSNLECKCESDGEWKCDVATRISTQISSNKTEDSPYTFTTTNLDNYESTIEEISRPNEPEDRPNLVAPNPVQPQPESPDTNSYDDETYNNYDDETYDNSDYDDYNPSENPKPVRPVRPNQPNSRPNSYFDQTRVRQDIKTPVQPVQPPRSTNPAVSGYKPYPSETNQNIPVSYNPNTNYQQVPTMPRNYGQAPAGQNIPVINQYNRNPPQTHFSPTNPYFNPDQTNNWQPTGINTVPNNGPLQRQPHSPPKYNYRYNYAASSSQQSSVPNPPFVNQQYEYQQNAFQTTNQNTPTGCEYNPCFPGTKCMSTYRSPGYECGACPFGTVGNGITCVPVDSEEADTDYGCGEKCDEILIEQEIIVAPCKLKLGGKCSPDTCAESNPCKDDETCVDEEDGTRCEPKPVPVQRAHRDQIVGKIQVEEFKDENDITKLLEELNDKFAVEQCTENSCYPGVTCTDTSRGPQCAKCPLGFKGDGKVCDKLTCDDQPCFPGAECAQINGEFVCGVCPTGYIGDGIFCTALTCKDKPCYPDVLCMDVPYVNAATSDVVVTCGECPHGMKGDGFTCEPITCDDIECYPGVECISDGVRCGPCPAGYEGNGTSCTEMIMGCALDPCYDGVECFESDGIVQCDACPASMVGDGFQCDFISCDDEPCYPGVECGETSTGYSCGACPELMQGNGIDCTYISCSDNPCFPGVQCMDISANISDDTYGEYDNYNDAYEFRQVQTGYLCGECPMGYGGDGVECARVGCTPNPCWPSVGCVESDEGAAECDECPIGMHGDGWECGPIPCSEWKCYDGVSCTDTDNGPMCGACPDNYAGDGMSCRDIRVHCDELSCYGECQDTDDGGVCDPCPEHFTGNGETCVDIRVYCDELVCYDGCHETDLGGVCNPCPDFFTGDGETCNDIRLHCDQIICHNGCEEKEFGGLCNECQDYYDDIYGNGSLCIDSRIHCDMIECFGNCTEYEDGGICDPCPEYFTGNGSDCIDSRIHCYEMDCFGNCSAFPSGGVCDPCPAGYDGNGTICALRVQLATSRAIALPECDELECYGNCTETEIGALCDPCPEYFEGDGVTCTDSRVECAQMICYGNCTNYEYGGECDDCPDYFIGNGTVCTDSRIHCSELDCFDGCQKTAAGGECDPCPEYHTGDGKTCVDNRTWCETMVCFGECQNYEHGGECAPCPRFFEGDGVNCEYTRTLFQNSSKIIVTI